LVLREYTTYDEAQRLVDGLSDAELQALQRAVQDVNRLENLPIRYRDVLPRRDLAGACYRLALLCTLLLLAARFMEIRQWR
jgi:hypothetical protein